MRTAFTAVIFPSRVSVSLPPARAPVPCLAFSRILRRRRRHRPSAAKSSSLTNMGNLEPEVMIDTSCVGQEEQRGRLFLSGLDDYVPGLQQ